MWQEPEKYSFISALISAGVVTFGYNLAWLPAIAIIAGTSIATYLMVIIGKYCVDLALHLKHVVTNIDKTIESVNARVVEAKATLEEVNDVMRKTGKTVATVEEQIKPLTTDVKNTLGHVNDTVDGMNPITLSSRAVGAAGSGLSNIGQTILSYLPFYGSSTTAATGTPTEAPVTRVLRSKQPRRR